MASNVLLARVLSPQDFGLVAMANLLLAFVGPFHDSGLSPAFVARTDAIRESAATIAWSTPVTGLGVAVVAVLAAPLAGALFARPDVVPVMRVLALAFLLNGLAVAPLAVISKELAFRAKAIVAVAAALTEGTVGIVLALRGAGYWSLVGAQLAGATMIGVVAWWLAPWKPLGRFVWARFREMARFGRHMVARNLLGLLGSRQHRGGPRARRRGARCLRDGLSLGPPVAASARNDREPGGLSELCHGTGRARAAAGRLPPRAAHRGHARTAGLARPDRGR